MAEIYSDFSWDDAQLTDALCNALTPTTDGLTWVHSGSNVLSLPSCFWTHAPRLIDVNIAADTNGAIIMPGSELVAGGDPLLSLASNISIFATSGLVFQNPVTGNGITTDGGLFTADFATFFSQRASTLSHLIAANCRLQGSLPSDMSSLTQLATIVLNDNHLSGPLPQALPSELVQCWLNRNNFTGELPSVLPPYVNDLDLSVNQLSGAISETFIESLSDFFKIDLSNNALNGTLPANLFANIGQTSSVTFKAAFNQITGTIAPTFLPKTGHFPECSGVHLDFRYNLLHGSVPADLFGGTVSWISCQFQFGNNRLDGAVPASLYTSMTAPALQSIQFEFNNNQLTGSVPDVWTHLAAPSALSIIFDFSSNRLSGSLPTLLPDGTMFPSLDVVYWLLQNNSLGGTIPPSLLQRNKPFISITMRLSNNALSGTLPPGLFQDSNGVMLMELRLEANNLTGPLEPQSAFHPVDVLSLGLSQNNFGGSIPSDYFQSYSAETSLIYMAGCGLSGSLPSIPPGMSVILDDNHLTSFSIDDIIGNMPPSPSAATVSIQNNRLEGVLNISSSPANQWLSLVLRNNSFTKVVFKEPMGYLKLLDISDNTNLVGTLPSSFFSNSSTLDALLAGNTKISGTFPDIPYRLDALLSQLNLSNTEVDFCSGALHSWNSSLLELCDLRNTNANECADIYPSQCQTDTAHPVAVPKSTPTTPTPSAPTPTEPSPNPLPNTPESVPMPIPAPQPIRVPTGAASNVAVRSIGVAVVLSLALLVL